jgi:hypothetical protein
MQSIEAEHPLRRSNRMNIHDRFRLPDLALYDVGRLQLSALMQILRIQH